MYRYASLMLCSLMLCTSISVMAAPKSFSEISADLPHTWEGEERTGFITGNRDEYMLTLGKKSPEGDSYIAQISIYILPNKTGLTARDSAFELAKQQDDATNPLQDGVFWQFTGYPKSNIVKGMAVTRVAATNEWWCFIISQDSQTDETETIIASFQGLTERSKFLLGK